MYVGTAEAVDALEPDLDNVRAALLSQLHGDAELAIGSDVEAAALMIEVLMPYWTTQGHSEEAASRIADLESVVDAPVSPRLDLCAGVAAAFNVEYDKAFERLGRARDAFEAAGSRTLLAWARFHLGRAQTVAVIAGMVENDVLPSAADALESAAAQFEARGESTGSALAEMFGGVNAVFRNAGDAEQRLTRALDLARSAGSVDLEAMASAMLALTDIRSGRFEAALTTFEESALALRRDRNWLNAQICTTLAGYAATLVGRDDARHFAAEACRLQVAFGSSEWDALTLTTSAIVALDVDVSLSERLVRTLNRHHPHWRQLVSAGFARLDALADVGPGPPMPTLTPVEAHRLAAAAFDA
jgi:tetratricopeptide (TPR) repeat protein